MTAPERVITAELVGGRWDGHTLPVQATTLGVPQAPVINMPGTCYQRSDTGRVGGLNGPVWIYKRKWDRDA